MSGCAGGDGASNDSAGGDDAADGSGLDVGLKLCTTAADCPKVSKACRQMTCTAEGACAEVEAADGTSCESGDGCVPQAACSAGSCVGANACACKTDEDCAAEDSDNLCLGKHFCDQSGDTPVCVINPATVVSCDDSLDTACEKRRCVPKTGACAMVKEPDGTACDDGEACTADDACAAGVCTGASSCECEQNSDCDAFDDGDACNGTLFCDVADHSCKPNPATVVVCPSVDAGACHASLCDPKTGKCAVGAVADGSECDLDGSSCSLDACAGGACKAGPLAAPCACKTDNDCQAFDDGDACNGTLYCSQPSGFCELNPASVVYCNKLDDTACSKNLCNKATGQCAFTALPDGTLCEDGWQCSSDETCSGGVCKAGKNVCECKTTADCAAFGEDNKCAEFYCDKPAGLCKANPATVLVCAEAGDPACSTTACDPKTGACVTKPSNEGGPCEADGSWCTSLDSCAGGVCKPATNHCPCSKDGDCAAFEDGDLCNGTLYCDKPSGACVVNPASVKVCKGDGDGPCKPLQCDAKDGACKALPLPEGATCDTDDFVCTAERCKQGKCEPIGQACLCWEDADCKAFDDGDLCNGSLYCDKTGGPPYCKLNPATVVKCPADADASGCSKTACDPAKGSCVAAPINEGDTCNDGNACTSGDICAGGTCAGAELTCDDDDPCSVDSCDKAKGCTTAPAADGVACDDGDPCSLDDSCAAGACVFSKTLDCDDGNPCTTDACEKGKGCVNKAGADGTACDDGDACLDKDACKAGTCVGGVDKVCDDGKVCTTDSCDKAKGCVNAPATGPACDDGNACTKGDACAAGTCTAGAPLACDDGEACTDDSCDAKKGCVVVSVADGKFCNDGDACTLNDTCKAGACQGGAALDCADGDMCTPDGCDKKVGCNNVSVPGAPCPGGTCDAKGCKLAPSAPTAWVGASVGLVAAGGALYGWGTKAAGLLPTAAKGEGPHPPAATAIAKATLVAVGDKRGCAIDGDGELTCWGTFDNGQTIEAKPLGQKPPMVWLGARGAQLRFVGDSGDVFAMADGNSLALTLSTPKQGGKAFVEVAVGANFECALRNDKTLWCSGQNGSGQLGLGAGVASGGLPANAPKQVPGLAAVEVCAGDEFACARQSDGKVLCWGSNVFGQLGGSATAQSPSPVTVAATDTSQGGKLKATSLRCGANHACITTDADTIACWGDNKYGQLGIGTTASIAATSAVSAGGGVAFAAKGGVLSAAGNTTCYIAGKQVSCWGDDSGGVLGLWTAGAATDPYIPAPVRRSDGSKLVGAYALEGSDGAFCVKTPSKPDDIESDTLWYCWGDNEGGLTLTPGDQSIGLAQQVSHLDMAWNVHITPSEGCVAGDGGLYCWGSNDKGATAGVAGAPVTKLTLVQGTMGADTFVRSNTHACAMVWDQQLGTTYVLCWGQGGFGQLGNGAKPAASKPVQVSNLGDVAALRAASNVTCARLFDGGLRCWGRGAFGLLGNGEATDSATPVVVSGNHNFNDFDVGGMHGCAAEAGKLWCWGFNGGQSANVLGANSNATSSTTPIAVPAFGGAGPSAQHVSVGNGTTCLTDDNAAVHCFGFNTGSMLGQGHDAAIPAAQQPVKPKGLPAIESVVVGRTAVCALTKPSDGKVDGEVWCWGSRRGGQVGRGTTFSSVAVTRSLP